MARVALLAVVVIFIVGFGGLTIGVLAQEGTTLGGLVFVAMSVFLVVVLGVGMIGALRKPPRR